MKAEDLFNKPLTRKEKAQVKGLQSMADSEIDYSDIPPLTEEQLSQFRSRRDAPKNPRRRAGGRESCSKL